MPNPKASLFRVYIKEAETDPWTPVVTEGELEDSRHQANPPLQIISLDQQVVARFLKFQAVAAWGSGAGLQFFGIVTGTG